MAGDIFRLGPRLALCAALVRPGAAVADIGTDHGRLPIWLIKTGKCPRAVAADINPGPLQAAQKNAQRYEAGSRLRLVLTDGLKGLGPQDAEDVVIAGMGGELILQLVREAPWLRDEGKRLVLQPMSRAPQLRQGLLELGFVITEEHACLDSGRPYTAFIAGPGDERTRLEAFEDPLYPFMGRLEPGSQAVALYAQRQAADLEKQALGAAHRGDEPHAQALRELAASLRRKYA